MSGPPVILLTCRNNLHLSKLAVRSALAQDVPCDVLLADNGSSDGTMAWAGSKNIATIAYTEQKSLSACWNAGIKAAWRAGAEAVLCCNNDTVLRKDALRLLLAHGGEFVSCVSVDSEEKMGTPGDRTVDDLRKTERNHPDFSAFLIRRSVTDKVGWFDEDCWPCYTEDSRFHVRCHRAGVCCLCVDVPFLHYGASTMKHASPGEVKRIRRGADKNRQTFKNLYGCLPGEGTAYDALFSQATFGSALHASQFALHR